MNKSFLMTREAINEAAVNILTKLKSIGVKTEKVLFCGGKNMRFGWMDLDKGVVIMDYEEILEKYFDNTPPNYKEFDIEWV